MNTISKAFTVPGRKLMNNRRAGFVPFGEARNIQSGGGRYISIVGRNGLFHHPADRWPEAVDVNAVAAYARAFVNLALALASEGKP